MLRGGHPGRAVRLAVSPAREFGAEFVGALRPGVVALVLARLRQARIGQVLEFSVVALMARLGGGDRAQEQPLRLRRVVAREMERRRPGI